MIFQWLGVVTPMWLGRGTRGVRGGLPGGRGGSLAFRRFTFADLFELGFDPAVRQFAVRSHRQLALVHQFFEMTAEGEDMLIAAAGEAALVHHHRAVIEIDQIADHVIDPIFAVAQRFRTVHPSRYMARKKRDH